MNLSEKSQILLDRYMLAVERRLPLQGRKDMIAEIKSNLMDTLEDHYPPEEVLSESMLEEELRKLGSPRSVAAAYFPTDALIGPQHNTIFRLVVIYLMPIVVSVVFFAGVLSFIISGGESPFWSIWELFGTAWQLAIGIIGTAAIILMILTRFFPQVNQNNVLDFLDEDQKSWRVSDLPELVVEQEKIHTWEPIAGIVFGFLGLAFWLFLFEDLAGIWWLVNEKWRMVPIFTEAFKTFIPWIAINIGLDILLSILLVQQERRGILVRMFEMVIKVSEITLIAALLKAGTLLRFDADLALSKGFPAEGIKGIQTLFQFDFVRWFLIFLLVVLSIDLLKKAVELIKGYWFKRVTG